MSDADLLAAVLSAEHATAYGYGVLGARLDDAGREEALAALDDHRRRRDDVAERLEALGVEPEGPRPSYGVAVADATEALQLAVRLEEGVGVRWRDLAGGTEDRALRRLAVEGLVETAVQATAWRQRLGLQPATVALPGVAG